jgi:dienelactone hydrolase
MRSIAGVACLLLALTVPPAAVTAQPLAAAPTLAERLRARAAEAPDLKLTPEVKKLRFFTPLENTVFRPEGDGRFPAIVLHHTCGGVGEHLRYWTQEALKRGFVVFVLDSLGPRNLKSVCVGETPVNVVRGAKDALDVASYLSTLDFVDSDRIALMGFSWGAMVGLYASSKSYAEALSNRRFTAVVSFYPACYAPPSFGAERPGVVFLRPDTDRPLLVLMGEADNETPPSDCLPRLAAIRDSGGPVEWHVYPGTTHAWDRRELHNVTKQVRNPERSVIYLHSKEFTADSTRRAFEFLARHLTK